MKPGVRGLPLRTASLCAAFLLALACDAPPAGSFTPVASVHCLLLAGTRQPVFVNRTYAITEPPDSILSGCEVLLWCRGDTWRLEQEVRWYWSDSCPLPGPLDTFGLRVACPGLDTVFARTTVPDTFSILFPEPGDTVTVSDSLVWTRSRAAAGYYMSFKRKFRNEEFWVSGLIPNESLPGLPYDSLVARIPMPFLSFEPEGPFALRLVAVDTAYADWVRFGAERAGTRLVGGIGVFGSGVERSVEVFVSHDTTGQEGPGK